MLRHALTAVPDDDLDVGHAEARQLHPRSRCEVIPALDAPDLDGKPGEQRALPAVARSDLQDALRARELERLDHGRDERGLRRHLPVRNRDRSIALCFRSKLGRNEVGPRDRGHGVEHARVGDTGERSRRDERVFRHVATMRAATA